MNWMLVLVAGTAVLAGPVVASVVAPSLVTGMAQQGFAVQHRHFVFNEELDLRTTEGREFHILLFDGDLYELPLTSQVVLRGAVFPMPTPAELDAAFQRIGEKYNLPILSRDVEIVDSDITITATLPAGVLANASPKYRELVAKYEA